LKKKVKFHPTEFPNLRKKSKAEITHYQKLEVEWFLQVGYVLKNISLIYVLSFC